MSLFHNGLMQGTPTRARLNDHDLDGKDSEQVQDQPFGHSFMLLFAGPLVAAYSLQPASMRDEQTS